MSKSYADGNRSTDSTTSSQSQIGQVRHSKDDALDAREFEQLVRACYQFDDYWSLQCRFVVFLAGRLGMRAGEIAHMTEEWVDWRRRMIQIPRHEECTNGRDDSVCGYCKQNAAQMADVRTEENLDELYASLGREDPLEPTRRSLQAVVDPEDLYQLFWQAKTDAAAREIPFDRVTRAELVLEEYFDRWSEYTNSRTSVNRRVTKAAEAADELNADDIYPHCLRSTAASYWAAREIDVFSLQSLLGWADLQTARRYVAQSGERTARAMRDSR